MITDYREWLINTLKNPEEALGYLKVAMEEYQEDGDAKALLLALTSVAMARGDLPQSTKENIVEKVERQLKTEACEFIQKYIETWRD